MPPFPLTTCTYSQAPRHRHLYLNPVLILTQSGLSKTVYPSAHVGPLLTGISWGALPFGRMFILGILGDLNKTNTFLILKD